MQIDERVIRQRIEKIVAWLSLLTTLVGVGERVTHYSKLIQKKRQNKKHPLGFRP